MAMAAKSYAYYRLVMTGPMSMAGTWSVGLAVTAPAAATAAGIQAWLDGIAADVASSYSNGTASWGAMATNGTNLAALRGYHYPAGSKNADLTAVHAYGTPVAGLAGTGAQTMSACAVSLLTNAAGRHNRGRCYVPADGATFENHQFTQAECNVVGAGFRDLIDHVNGSTIGGEDAQVVIASQLPTPPVVTRVRVDSLPDTQRPRADGQNSLHVFSDDV